MQRYFIEDSLENFETCPYTITGEQFHHMTRVLRMRVEDTVYLVDCHQSAYIAKITEITDTIVILSFVKGVEISSELPLFVTICIGLSKGDKLETIVQKATELGVHRIIPLQLERNVVKWKQDKAEQKLKRLKKIAQEAAEQSHRHVVPDILALHTIEQLKELIEETDIRLVAYEESAKQGEYQQFARCMQQAQSGQHIILFFGAEGGLTTAEIEQLQSYGVIPCSLGPRILRAETAPLYALSAISYQIELVNNLK